MTSQKLKFVKLLEFDQIFGKSAMKNARLPKIIILLQFGGKILALTNPSNFASFPNVRNRGKIRRVCMESFLVMLFLDIKSNPIISQIWFS